MGNCNSGTGCHLCDILNLKGSVLNQHGCGSALVIPEAKLAVLVLTPCVHSACITAEHLLLTCHNAMVSITLLLEAEPT